MPERLPPDDVASWFNHILERLRLVERLDFQVDIPEIPDPLPGLYTWQSAANLTTGLGHKFFADRSGSIVYVRAERSAGDGSTDATFDLLIDGRSPFTTFTTYPTVEAGQDLGKEIQLGARREASEWREGNPQFGYRFEKGDSFQVNITSTGGGSGPLRLSIHFIPDVPRPLGQEPVL